MRKKTYYLGSAPEMYGIHQRGNGECIVFLRENIQKTGQDACGVDLYEADEYTMTVPASARLPERVGNDFARWLALAKANDYAEAAKAVREKRNALLAETDKEMAFDRLRIELPENVTALTLLTGFVDFIRSVKEIRDGRMAKYRQALRDITRQPGFPYDVTFPEKPE